MLSSLLKQDHPTRSSQQESQYSDMPNHYAQTIQMEPKGRSGFML